MQIRWQKILNSEVRLNNKYILQLNSKYSIDGEPTTSSFARYCNMARNKDIDLTGKKMRNNAQLNASKIPNVVATRIVRVGDEILLSYGPSYWKDIDREKRDTYKAIAQVAALPSVKAVKMIKSNVKTIPKS